MPSDPSPATVERVAKAMWLSYSNGDPAAWDEGYIAGDTRWPQYARAAIAAMGEESAPNQCAHNLWSWTPDCPSCRAARARFDALVGAAPVDESEERWQRATALCAEHQPSGGIRAECLVCSLVSLSRVISRIDYALGEPNEMELSTYDVAPVAEAVLERVVAQRAREKRLRDALEDALMGLAIFGVEELGAPRGLEAALERGRAALSEQETN